jgi:hypothetical protein
VLPLFETNAANSGSANHGRVQRNTGIDGDHDLPLITAVYVVARGAVELEHEARVASVLTNPHLDDLHRLG